MKLKTFVGFKGTCAMVEIGKVRFMILASNTRELEILWASILSAAGPFDPTRCNKAILISSKDLPESTATPKHEDALDRLNAQLAAEES